MSTGVPNRKDAREHFKTNIETDITELELVFDYVPKSHKGKSPVCAIWSGPIMYALDTNIEHQRVALFVGFWVRDDGEVGSGITAEDAEDKLDDLAQALAHVCLDHYQDPAWGADSEQFPEIVDGKSYQAEVHLIHFDWWDYSERS